MFRFLNFIFYYYIIKNITKKLFLIYRYKKNMGISSSKEEKYAFDENVENIYTKKMCIKKQLEMLERYVKIDIRDVDKKRAILEQIYEDKNRFINQEHFIKTYNDVYNNLSLLGKTAFDICKTEFTIRYANDNISLS